ncbi:MAG: hypothetical protein GX790_06710, partial [Syntrophomonadaceae bacterium]|nr:hypothetical protein [Syntrophomonadaceae bacterium]
KPAHYYFYIKDALENAVKLSEIQGRNIPPILVIFEDAEKLGQWSKDPEGDLEWMMEFFELVSQDDELEFIGLKQYIDKYGFFDTYPVTLSHSYPEWENWTAKRGIRGVNYGDERLRRVICRLRDFEAKQELFENQVLDTLNAKLLDLDTDIKEIINRSVLNSPERYELIAKILKNDSDKVSLYEIINRVRNLVYQEDPKWASRHPSYGSSPFYDVTGLAYLEIAYKVLKSMAGEDLSLQEYKKLDWDYDGQDEVLIENKYQTVVIDPQGGCISYQNVMAPSVADNIDKMKDILIQDSNLPAYNSIYRHAYPIVFTEADSDMAVKFYEEGGRKEVSRNAFRCEVLVKDGDAFDIVGSFDTAQYNILSIEELDDEIKVVLSCEQVVNLNKKDVSIILTKTFIVGKQNIKCIFELNKPDDLTVYLSPQIVSSAAASDEVEFKPVSFIGIEGTSGELKLNVEDISIITAEGIEYKSISADTQYPEAIDYLYQIKSANGNEFWNCLSYNLSTEGKMESIYVRPAVREYYKNYVFENQSSLGYHTSGISIIPIITAEGSKITFEVTTTWELDTIKDKKAYQQVFNLIE